MDKSIDQTKYSRITRNYVQTINAEPQHVHSLICPVKEAEWLDGWNYNIIFSESGMVEKECVFTSENREEGKTLWYISERDDENYLTEFIRFNPDSKIAKLRIKIEELDEKHSKVYISYIFTALSEKGLKYNRNLTEDTFEKNMQFWEKSMNHYIETGKTLKNPYQDEWAKFQVKFKNE